ncbi:MAG: zinc ABC transporter permease subunit ZnuB [Magnetococcales bacterium]|nr:zinc ABC transporter permease subunit ZnuB [Magnetococcales bacterium]
MLDDFFARAMLAGIGVALITGPLGCFIVWRRMAYFGDTVAHSALLGVALGFAFDVDPTLAVGGVAISISVLLAVLQQQRWVAVDTLLGILSHASLSVGLVVIGLLTWLRIDLMGYLFGDILAVTEADIYRVYIGGAVALITLVFLWRPLLAITVHEDLARAEGVKALPVRLALMILVALVIAVAMKIVGILLITALLIIPAATARRFSSSPESMALFAILIGMFSVAVGLSVSLNYDTPSGPSIVSAAALCFVLVFSSHLLTKGVRRWLNRSG